MILKIGRENIKNMWNRKLPRRYLLCLLMFFGVFILYALRLNLSVAVVAMTTDKTIKLENGTILKVKDFNWTSEEKGYVLGSFYYGYILTEFSCGWLSHRYGGSTIFGLEVAIAGLFTMAIPFVTVYGAHAVSLFRALAGIFEGGLYPSTQAIWSRWAPASERTRLSAMSYNGLYFANVICLPTYGIIAAYWGWQILFYIPGAVAIVWCFVWFLNVKSSPAEDPKITEIELTHINSEIGSDGPNKQIPWNEMFKSMPFWSIIVVHFTQSWGYVIMFTYLPSYMSDTWKFTVEQAGFWLTVPAVVGVIVMPLVGVLADYLRTQKGYSTIAVRKFCQAIAGFGSAISVALIAFSSGPILSVCLLSVFQCVDPFVFGSFYVSPLDIAPEYAGVITGIASTVSSLSGVMSPIATGYIVKHQTYSEWRTNFLICVAMYIIGTVFYLMFASADIQPWARTDKRSNEDKGVTS